MPQFYETFLKYLHRMILPDSALPTAGYLSSLSSYSSFPFISPSLLGFINSIFSGVLQAEKKNKFSYSFLFILSSHTPTGYPGWSLTLGPLEY